MPIFARKIQGLINEWCGFNIKSKESRIEYFFLILLESSTEKFYTERLQLYVSTIDSSADIQSIVELGPNCVQHVSCYWWYCLINSVL